MISKEEYRKILNDYVSTEEQVDKRLKYLETLLRNVARDELEKYATDYKKTNAK